MKLSQAPVMADESRLRKLWSWFGDPWTQAERDTESADLEAILSDATVRGAVTAAGTQRSVDRMRSRHRRRRRRLRVLGALIIVIAVSAFLTAFTDNRVVRGISIAATASAAPVALFLGLRRD